MTIEYWFKLAQASLSAAGIATDRLDALVLLEDAMGVNRTRLLAYPDMEIPDETQNVLSAQLKQRAKHVPLAYVRGKTEFYGREFVVTNAVLEPRPESEAMIELLLRYMKVDSRLRGNDDVGAVLRIADVGTGSGALGITAKLELSKAKVELPEVVVDLLEIDDKASKVAKMNVIKFTSGNQVIHTDLLDGSPGEYDVLLCNLPYVPDDYTINPAAQHEPKVAIFGGPDGLDLYRRLFEQISTLKKQPLLILCESLPAQHEALQSIAAQNGYLCDAEEDFIQVFILEN